MLGAWNRSIVVLACLAVAAGGWLGLARAADAASDPAEKPATSAPDAPLVARQRQIADRYLDLEKLLLRMAELTAPTDPHRAALLRRAVAQSKQRDIDHQFEELIALLEKERLSLVVKSQGEVHDDLVRLLELLLSEDRGKRIESEKERIREYLKRVNKIIKDQQHIQGETSRDADARKLADRQGELADKTGEIANQMKDDAGGTSKEDKGQKSDAKDGKPGKDSPKDKPATPGADDAPQDKPRDPQGDADKNDGQPKDSDKKDTEKKGTDKKDAEKKDADSSKDDAKDAGDKKDGDASPKDGKDADSKPGDKQQGKPQDADQGSPSEAQPQGDQQQAGQGESQPAEQNPAQKRLEQAEKRMKEAQQKLEEANRSEAKDKQAEALKELEQAKAELEEILRQLREEEVSRTLAMLEGRFRKMLDEQVAIYEGTTRLDSVPQAERDRDDEIEAGRLSRKEAQIAIEADKALAVLHEEGSATAFPEAVGEMREDMQTIVDRLAQAKVGEMTQGVEQDVIAALEEMIASLEKAQKEMDAKSKSGEPPQGEMDDELPLVDTLSELKMIRALQMRVNVRTQRYAAMTESEQTDKPELLKALKQLADREQRIHKVTRDIVVGRNQ